MAQSGSRIGLRAQRRSPSHIRAETNPFQRAQRILTNKLSILNIHGAGKTETQVGRTDRRTNPNISETEKQPSEPRFLPGIAESPQMKCTGGPDPAPWHILDQ